MADVTAIRGALAAKLTPLIADDVAGRLRVRAVPVFLNCSQGPALDILGINILVAVGSAKDYRNRIEECLDVLLDPHAAFAVRKMLEADRTLGGLVSDLHVEKCYGYMAFPGSDFGLTGDQFGSAWLVHCLI